MLQYFFDNFAFERTKHANPKKGEECLLNQFDVTNNSTYNDDEKININDILIISCNFGNKWLYVHPAPKVPNQKNCVFFTNNKNMKNIIIENNWQYEFIDSMANFNNRDPSTDYIQQSIYSKYIKFLQFLTNETYKKKYGHYKTILYFDNKINITKDYIDNLINISYYYCNYYVLLANGNNNKTYQNEIKDASDQERYNRSMPKTIKFLNKKYNINSNDYKKIKPLINTGILFYHNYEYLINTLLSDVYKSIIKLNQPECQLIINILALKYTKNILLFELDMQLFDNYYKKNDYYRKNKILNKNLTKH